MILISYLVTINLFALTENEDLKIACEKLKRTPSKFNAESFSYDISNKNGWICSNRYRMQLIKNKLFKAEKDSEILTPNIIDMATDPDPIVVHEISTLKLLGGLLLSFASGGFVGLLIGR